MHWGLDENRRRIVLYLCLMATYLLPTRPAAARSKPL
jgi:hypothetical protein